MLSSPSDKKPFFGVTSEFGRTAVRLSYVYFFNLVNSNTHESNTQETDSTKLNSVKHLAFNTPMFFFKVVSLYNKTSSGALNTISVF